MDKDIREKLVRLKSRFNEINLKLLEHAGKSQEYQSLLKERAQLEEIVETFVEYEKMERHIEESVQLMKDKEMRALAEAEKNSLQEKQVILESRLKQLLLPRDPHWDKNIVLEIRAGAGGDEAALFVSDLFRMYNKYGEIQGWKTEILSSSSTGIGGCKEIIALISGKEVYKKLRFESGVHRVQRVPVTEAQGRIHTSTVTVAILPEVDEVEVAIQPQDLKIDVFRSSGPGGQSVNTTDSAVRVTHVPTGLVVSCQDEKSQHKNKAKALKILRSRLAAKMEAEEQLKLSQERKKQMGTGERSERIRTYNFPQGRVTDHRIGLTIKNIDAILDGRGLEEIIVALESDFIAQSLKEETA